MIHHKPSAKRRQPARAETAAPAVERAIQLLKLLGDRPHGLTGQALADASGIPRATLFRMLKALAHHAFIQPAPDGG